MITVEFVGGKLDGGTEHIMAPGRRVPPTLHERYVFVELDGRRAMYAYLPERSGIRVLSGCKCGFRGCPNFGKTSK